MHDPEIHRTAGNPLAQELPVTQFLGDVLEKKGVCGKSSIGVAFRYPALEVVFVNAMGQTILCPKFEKSDATSEFNFKDIISISDKRKFEAEVNPMLQVSGNWYGELILRDLWGGDVPSSVRLWNGKLDSESTEKYLFLHGEPQNGNSFTSIRGWRDRELLLALLSHSKSNIYFKDRESRFLRASHSLISKFGLKNPHEVIGKTDFSFFAISHASEAYEDEQEIVRTGVPIINKEEMETLDSGEVTWGATSKYPLFDGEGNVIGTFGITRDITAEKEAAEKRKDLEVRLHLAQRLEAIGSLAAGVAHEINTPTQFVSDNIKFLTDSFSDIRDYLEKCAAFVERTKGIEELNTERDALLASAVDLDLDFIQEEIPQTLSQSTDGLSQIAKIVSSMKEFSYPSSPEKSKCDINHAIENTINVARNEWKGIAELELNLAPDLPKVSCKIDEINQVVLNLVVNAVHAIEATESRQGRLSVSTGVEGGVISIEIEDTGVGMTEEVKERMFEQFFTTKEVGKGTGQGLAMVRNIVVAGHGGDIQCESVLGVGTKFTVRLPVDAKDEEVESSDNRS